MMTEQYCVESVHACTPSVKDSSLSLHAITNIFHLPPPPKRYFLEGIGGISTGILGQRSRNR